MPQSNQSILKKRYQFSSLRLSDPELDELEKHPPDEEPPEDISYEEVIPEDAPPRKNVSEELPEKEIGGEKSPLKKKNRDPEDKSNNYTPPAQICFLW